MGLNGGDGDGVEAGREGGGGDTRLRQRQRERAMRTQTEAASNGSLMRDGQCGLYLITNQHSFEFSGERKCRL